MIVYKKGNLFDAPVNSSTILVHACNCEGQWGSGVAVPFRQNFPLAYEDYQQWCQENKYTLIGTSLICDRQEPAVGCLFTSRSYGKNKDNVDQITSATDRAIRHMFNFLPYLGIKEIHSPKINAGLFAVPWDKTESIINKHLALNPEITWTVWEL